MQNVGQSAGSDSMKGVKTVEVGQATLAPSSPVMERAQVLRAIQQNLSPNFIADLSGSEEEEVSEVESFILDQEDLEDGEPVLDTSKFLLSSENMEGVQTVDPETQARLEALLEAAGIGKLSTADGKAFADPEVLRRLTSSVSCALDEAAAALTRMRTEQQGQTAQGDSARSLAEACSDGDISTVRKLLDEGRSVHETTEEGESLLSLACSAGYYELAQVLLAMRANVEDRGIKGDCTPLMEAASGGYVDIVRLLIAHGADVNAQSSAGNTPLHYAACGGYKDVVKVLIEAGANVEEHNENGHTPLMEAASAGHVEVAKILLEAGAGINTHSNEFKESALTLACYKGHLEMVKFLLEAGADQDHKTDEMHTALMEASMDGHVEVARLLLDSGAQVNMPADSFESPLTLAACGGHVELANLLIERGANLEEVNDEGYTPLMEAAREGHEEMVALLLAHGADINAQTEETQETALTLACCGGFLEVADFLIKAGADLELGCSTPLMEASQEGHLELVKYLLKAGANVHAQTGTGDTALTYACENGHTDVADVLLQSGAELEHESEGGRTPLMKAARSGHLCTVQFLISKGADVNRQTSTNDHTVLSLACAGGHLGVVELLLRHGGNASHRLKDGSTMLIEAAKGGHTAVVNLLLDYPNNLLSPASDFGQLTPPDANVNELPRVPMQGLNNIVPPQDPDPLSHSSTNYTPNIQPGVPQVPGQVNLKDLNIPARTSDQIRQNMQKSLSKSLLRAGNRLSEAELQQIKNTMQASDLETDFGYDYEKGYTESGSPVSLELDDRPDMKASERLEAFINKMMKKAELLNTTREEQILKKQQILEELQKVERELQEKAKAQLMLNTRNQLEQQAQLLLNAQQRLGQQEQEQQQQQIQQQQQQIQQQQMPQSPQGGNQQQLQHLSADQLLLITRNQLEQQAQLLLNAKHRLEQQRQQQIQGQQEPQSSDQQLAQQVLNDPPRPLHIALAKQLKAKKQGSGAENTDPSRQISEPSSSSEGDGHLSNGSSVSDVTSAQQMGNQGLYGQPSETYESGEAENGNLEGQYVSLDQERLGQADGAEACQLQLQELSLEQAALYGAELIGGEQGAFLMENQILEHSRASSEEVDLSDVLVAEAGQQGASQETMGPRPTTLEGSAEPQPEQGMSGEQAPAGLLTREQLLALQAQQPGMPLQSMLEPLQQCGEAASADQTHTHLQLQQHRQQLQAQLALQQQLQQELQQQLKLQQERQQLQQQLKIQQAVGQHVVQQQRDLQQQQEQLQHQQFQVPQPVVTQAQQQDAQLQLQQVQLNVQQQIKLQQVQQSVQQLQQMQQLQTSPQLSQAELLVQAQQLQQQLQQAQQLQLNQQKQIANLQNVSNKKSKKQKQLPLVGTQQVAATTTTSTTTTQAQQTVNNFAANTISAPPLDAITPPSSTPMTPNPSPASPQISPPVYPSLDLDAQTESNHDTALTLACAGGHSELVNLLLSRGSDIEHRDKKGFTPLILAATAGHTDVVEILLDHGADIEAQSERTKDTPLSLACSGGRYEVVELLLGRGANKEHRNVSDYTPLSLAASGGYVNIIKLLLSHGAEINSRTGSKLGISPLMLAAMNGHTTAVKLLLDMGSDINAQIETNRNTALTLACFQGRHEVVSLLVDRKANIEHRAKTGLTPLMEAASGGYVEVGRVLLDKGADVNAPPVPSSRDTALTIAADKGHYRFVELLLSKGAAVDVKNKKGNSPLWLACNGGHLDVVQLLVTNGADIDSQDNRKVSCLMAAFRKGHIKVVKWMVKHVTQFPSDQECMRFIATITDKELLKKCHQCMEIIVSAKDRQAAEANKNASILLEELDLEKSREESKKAAAARKREKRRKKKKEKQEKEKEKEASKNSSPEPESRQNREQEEEKDDNDNEDEEEEEEKTIPVPMPPTATTVSTMGTSIITESKNARNKKNNNSNNMSKAETNTTNSSDTHISTKNKNKRNRRERDRDREQKREQDRMPSHTPRVPTSGSACTTTTSTVSHTSTSSTHTNRRKRSELTTVSTTGIGDLDDFGTLPANLKISPKDKEKGRSKGPNEKNNRVSSLDTFGMPLLSPAKGGGGGAGLKSPGVTSPKRGQKKEEGWKEVIRKSKKVSVPSSAISRVIGRGGCNINAIREVSGAHIEVDKQPQKGSGDRIITIKGSADATRQAHALITALIKDPDKELEQILPKYRNKCANVAVTTISISVTSSNVWHNSMANNIPTTVITATTTINTPSQKSPPVGRSGNVRQSSPAVSLPPSGMTQSPQGPVGPGSGRHSTGMVLVRPPPTIPLQGTQVQTGTQVWNGFGTSTGSPKRNTNGKLNSSTSITTASLQSSMCSVSTIMAHSKSPSAVSRQLFPNEKKASSAQNIATVTKTPVTYTTAPVSKPKTVASTTTTTFAAKVDNKMQPVGTRNLQRTSGPNTNKPHSNIPSGMAKSDPQPLPIKASVIQMLQQGAMMQASLGQGSGEYSPFNNLFSQVAEQVLGKKDDQSENRMNFASVAAAGVVTTSGASSLPNTSMGPPLPSNNDSDPNLPAKAPGYKPMGQGPPGTGIPDMDLAKAPGYRGNIPLHALSHAQVEMEMLKTPGYRGGVPLSQPSLSPRSAGSTPGGQSPRDIMAMAGDAAFLLAQHGSRDVYTTPDQPMTLPKIESNLNPNAPDFTSRSTGTPQQPHPGHQGVPPQGFSGTPPLNPNLPPNPSAFRPPHPSLLGQQAFGSMPPPPQSGGPFLPGASGNMAVGDFTALQTMAGFGVNASTFSGSGANMNVPSSLPRQYSPLPAGTRSASTTPSVGASSKDGGSPVPAVSSETSPMSSNAPSPTDHVKHTGEDRKLPRPIGTERAQNKKPPGAGYGAGMGDMGPAAGIWGFSQELSSEWISSVSSVMTSSVVTSSSGMTPNSTSDGEERSTGTPGPRMIPRPFLEGGVMDQSIDQTLQGQPMMVPNGNSLQFANGLPPGALPMAALYAQGAMPGAAETIAPLWNQQMKASASDGTSDPNKLMWNNWNQQPPNM